MIAAAFSLLACDRSTATVEHFDAASDAAQDGIGSVDANANDARAASVDATVDTIGDGGIASQPAHNLVLFSSLGASTPAGSLVYTIANGFGLSYLGAGVEAAQVARIEQAFDKLFGSGKVVPTNVGCVVPSRPSARPATFRPQSLANAGRTMMKEFADLTAAAFACGLSRVAVINASGVHPDDFGVPNFQGSIEQDIYANAVPGNEEYRRLGEIYRAYAFRFADLIESFRVRGLLQNTTLVWVTDEAERHDLNDLMFVVAGGVGGAFRTGRYLKYAENGLPPSRTTGNVDCALKIGPPHSQLLVSLQQSMGVKANSFGIEALENCNKVEQPKINLTGPFPRLR